MKTTNRVTLKSLQARLDALTASKSSKLVKPPVETHKASAVGHDIKQSYIQNLHMRSSMFYLWVISGILGYAHRIPFLGRIITLLSIWYGRTTIWKILLKLRRLFIIFNALIGVFMVYKTVGFSTDNVFAGFAGMGHTYLEILTNSTKRLFHWFFELFDHKIVPNVPGDGPSKPSKFPLWSPIDKGAFNPFLNNELSKSDFSLRELYKSPFNININTPSVPWYRDLSNLIWIGTIVGASVGILGIGYLGWIYLSDPIMSFFRSGPATNINPPTPDGVDGAPIELAEVSKGLKSSIASYLFNPFRK
jgi:hypothetical protein